jgi:dephospho-CoA kinase
MVIGLTGGIGTGKSTVARRLIEKGYPVIDTDIISKEIIEKEEIIIKINEELGDVLDYNGKINRKKLGQIVFKDKKKLNVLNSIMHPIILNEMRKQINEKNKLHNIIIVDVPLLFEINIEKEFDLILLVYSTKEIQLKRIMERDNRTKEEALNIINSQMDLELKKKKSDYILKNNNTLKDLYEEIDNVLEKLEKLVL